jgi:DNA-binding NtrC family response regulator
VQEGLFRQDLYFRLNVIDIRLPPLRERRDDLPDLCNSLLSRIAQEYGLATTPKLSASALALLAQHPLEGNVRELENAIERAVIIASGRQIELDDLPEAISRTADHASAHARHERAAAAGLGNAIGIQIELPSAMDEIEKQVIEATLDYTEGDKSHAARLLNIGRKTLYRKLEQYESEQGQPS